MIGIDLLYRHLPMETAKRYLGEPEQWITLSLGQVYDRLRARGWEVATDIDPAVLIAKMIADQIASIPDFVADAPGEGVHEMPTPSGPAAAEVPRASYRCAKGHTWTAIGEYRWEAHYQPFLRSELLCPYCVIQFANTLFPAERAG